MPLRLRLRTRMALIWGLGYVLLGVAMLLVIGALTQQRIAEDPADASLLFVTTFGLEATDAGELTVSDPAGNTVTIDRVIPKFLDTIEATRQGIMRRFAVVLPLLALSAGLLGWWVAGGAMRPIAAMADLAGQVSSERLDARIDHQGPHDELKELADAFDVMMERLERAFARQRQFAAAASHELRTPLTLIRAELDVAIDTSSADGPDPEELADMAEGIRGALARSEAVIDGLLLLARTGVVETTRPVDLGELAEHALDQLADTADARGITVATQVEEGVAVLGDPVLLRRLVDNLVGNAVRHTLDGGRIEVRVEGANGQAVLRLRNTGRRMVADEVSRLGEPFFRPRASRETPGTGLGVTIARSIAESHGGTLRLTPGPGGGGLTANVTLPTRRVPTSPG